LNVTAISTTAPGLTLWAIYRSPADYPDKWVLRQWTIEDGQLRAGEVDMGDSLEEIRVLLPTHARIIAREPDDAQCMIETWI
jgi:hypothetical protein